MSMTSSQPVTLFQFDFSELYLRHLCRHSQYGNNLAHLVALFGMWYGVYALILHLTGAQWLVAALALAYLVLIAFNAPARVLLVTAIFMGLFLAAVIWLPSLPLWAYVVMIPVFYEIQQLSHKVFTVEKDMTAFEERYRKGPVLFVILLIFEVPLVLNYLIFGRSDWAA
jgi:hypothetical protein